MKARRGRGEGQVRQRDDGRWEGRASFGFDANDRRIRKSVYGKSKEDVLTKIARLRLGTKVAPLSNGQTLGAFLRWWLEQIVKPNNRIATYRQRRWAIERHLKHIHWIRMTAISPMHVQDLVSHLRRTKVGATAIRTVFVTLSTALNCAVRFGEIETNPCHRVSRPKATPRERVWLDHEQAIRLLKSTRSQHLLHTLLLLALTTGMREGEILALKWKGVDLDEGVIRVEGTLTTDMRWKLVVTPPKTRSSVRRIALPKVTIRALERLARSVPGRSPDSFVFPAEGGKPQRKESFMRRRFRPALERAGLPKVTFHSLRHSSNSFLIGEGVSVRTVADRMGHSSTRMTLDTYAHVLPVMQDTAAMYFDRLFGDAGLGVNWGSNTSRLRGRKKRHTRANMGV